jgi:hypothetical protein
MIINKIKKTQKNKNKIMIIIERRTSQFVMFDVSILIFNLNN